MNHMNGGESRQRARRVVAIGVVTIVISAVVLMSPLLLGAKLGKYFAAPAIIGLCAGASMMLLGALDWWRR